MMKKCPKCGSRRIAPILYGMPAFSEEMEQQLNEEKLYLGGCCISGIPDNKTIEISVSKDFCAENGVSFAVAASYYGAKAYKNALAAFDGENDLNLSFTYSGSDAPICRVFFLDSAFRPVCKNLTHEIVE